MGDYLYDVFLSWKRSEPVLGWFRHYFRGLFEAHLRSTLGQEPRVFCDEGVIETGDAWPVHIAEALRRSKLLVPIWEPQYFRSAWCMCELQSMARRERAVGLRSAERPHGLILPLVVKDGRHFQSWLDVMQVRRLPEGCLTDAPALRSSAAWVDGLIPCIEGLCADVEAALSRVPDWSDAFPVVHEVERDPPVRFPMPRFSPERP